MIQENPDWKDAQVRNWDFYAPIPDTLRNSFDVVFSNNVLQRISYLSTLDTIKTWVDCLTEGGQFHLIVPSLEWACREVLHDRPSPACLIALFGGQGADGSTHLSGFTMRLLRADFEKSGLSVVKAQTIPYTMTVIDSKTAQRKEWQMEQHYIVGVKGRPELRKE